MYLRKCQKRQLFPFIPYICSQISVNFTLELTKFHLSFLCFSKMQILLKVIHCCCEVLLYKLIEAYNIFVGIIY